MNNLPDFSSLNSTWQSCTTLNNIFLGLIHCILKHPSYSQNLKTCSYTAPQTYSTERVCLRESTGDLSILTLDHLAPQPFVTNLTSEQRSNDVHNNHPKPTSTQFEQCNALFTCENSHRKDTDLWWDEQHGWQKCVPTVAGRPQLTTQLQHSVQLALCTVKCSHQQYWQYRKGNSQKNSSYHCYPSAAYNFYRLHPTCPKYCGMPLSTIFNVENGSH
jgi:hypothetical protein